VVSLIEEIEVETSKLVEEFIATLDLSYNTVISYAGILKRYVCYLNEHKINHPKEADLVKYKNNYLKKKVRSATVQKYVVVLRKFYRWCYRHGYYGDISQGLTGEKIVPTFKREALTIETVKKLLHKAKLRAKKSLNNFRDYVIIRLIIVTGLRTIEVSRANVEDLGKLNGIDVLYIQGKGHDDKDSYVKLPKDLRDLIDEYIRKRNTEDEALFSNHGPHSVNSHIDSKTISLNVKNLLRAIGVDSIKYTAHSLRHTCATLALKNGCSIQEVQMLLRHKSLTTTTIYAHNIEREDNNAEFVVDRLLNKKR
jgi:Site-specific recombinase XerD